MMDPLPVVVSVRGLPPALPPNAVHSLMRHLGASHIRLHNVCRPTLFRKHSWGIAANACST